MAKVDLHVHSKYSDFPSTFVHKAYQSPESFTETEMIYQQAKSRGMTFVTITDHDDIRGSLELHAAHPSDTFVSCEITSYFPSDECKIHILVYGISEQQYEYIMLIRRDIFKLRDYIAAQNIAYSVAHATYDQDGKLRFEHIEKLVLLFDIFEVINGSSGIKRNILLQRYLESLNKDSILHLQSKYKIKPISDTPWIKGFTGGSDDHCGILIGSTYTKVQSPTKTPADFLTQLRNKSSIADGSHGNFESYATGVIKHIHDYRRDRDPKYLKTKMNDFLELFFVGENGNWVKRFKKSHSLRYLKKKNNKIYNNLHDLLKQISTDSATRIENKIPMAYEHIARLHDEMFCSTIAALSKSLPSGEIFKATQKLATVFPMTLLAAPFIGSMRHQVLKSELKRALIEGTQLRYTERALWFTDTIDDLNGVSVSLRQIASYGHKLGYQLKLVTCVNEVTLKTPLPSNTVNLAPIKEVVAPGYETQIIAFPSLLSVMRKVIEEQPDQIIISTPGPLGLAAMFCAKLMDLPIKAIYHTDFAEQILRMTDESMLANVADTLVNLFYKQADQVYVPSRAYIDKLASDGLPQSKLSIFPRGLDMELYRPCSNSTPLTIKHQLRGSFTWLFAGRISEDKNLSLLIDTFKLASQQKPGLYNLVIAGDGPDLKNVKKALSTISNVHFTGRLSPEQLVGWYRSCDVFIFPSHTDTFGMVVLEAQACGLPCLVTASGGPKEIISAGQTGHIIHTDLPEDWLSVITEYRRMKLARPDEFKALQQACVKHIHQQNSWQPVFDAVLGSECLLPDNENEQKFCLSMHGNTSNTDDAKAGQSEQGLAA